MPLVPYSTAAALVNAITPAFAALYTLVGSTHVDYSGLVLGSLLATLPLMLIFFVFQRQFVAGLLGGAVKG